MLYGLDWAVYAVVLLHLLAAPCTKVEESFSVQATHDLLFHADHIAAYDHLQFPGVVPRTFIPPLVLSALAWPLLRVADRILPPLHRAPKLLALLGVRAILGALVTAALGRFRRALGRVFGPPAGACFALLALLQFHLPFYASRLLPNTFALATSSLALAYWLERRRPYGVVFLMAFTATVLRCDTLLLAAPLGLEMLWSGDLGLLQGVAAGAASVLGSVGVSVAVDSFFWRRVLWPEGEVFKFNAVENRSHEWGTAPPHWYLTSALPRALGASLVLAALGALALKDRKPYFRLLFPGLFFVGAYSWLPHKELRFLLPVLPLFTGAAAVVLARIISAAPGPAPSLPPAPRRWCRPALLLLLPSAAFSVLALWASALNYPGGEALLRLHEIGLASGRERARVHIGVLPAMTGVSRFLELPPSSGWAYSKQEGLTPGNLADAGFDFLLTDAATRDALLHGGGYAVVGAGQQYAGWDKARLLRTLGRGLGRGASWPWGGVARVVGAQWRAEGAAGGPLDLGARAVRCLRALAAAAIRMGAPRTEPAVFVLERTGTVDERTGPGPEVIVAADRE